METLTAMPDMRGMACGQRVSESVFYDPGGMGIVRAELVPEELDPLQPIGSPTWRG